MAQTLVDVLSSLPCLLTLVLLLLSFYLKPFLKNRQQNLAQNLPPCPPCLPIIGNLHLLGKLPHFSLWKLSQKYGPVLFLKLGSVPTIVVSSPEMAREVMKTHDSECCTRPYSRGTFTLSYNSLDLAFGPYTEYWKEMRKLLMTELFAARRVQMFSHIREEEVSRLITSLSGESSSSSSKSVDVSDKIFNLLSTIICKIAFGGSYEGKIFEGRRFQENIDEAMEMLSSFWASDFFPSLGWIFDVIQGRHTQLRKCFWEFDKFYECVIEEHLVQGKPSFEHEDVTDSLLRLSNDETADFRLSRDHIKGLLMDIFIGGTDTSALTITWAMTELMRNPRAMKKVQQEIRSCVGNKPKVEETEIGKLRYLKMVVKETFRLHPPATLLLPRESIRQFKLGEYDVCPKTRILVNVWAIGRDPNAWKNPNEFYPERFEDGSIDFRGNNFELVPFGAGRRICPGLIMGATAIEFTLANLLHCFDWELPLGMKKEDISLEEEAGLTVHKKSPLYLVPIKYNWEGHTV